MEIRYLKSAISVEKRSDGQDSRKIIGYALKFDTVSDPIWGCFTETICRGALDGADVSDVVAKYNHGYDSLLARTKSGTLTLTVDAIGLRFEFDAPNTTEGNDVLEMVRRGDLSECSFGMIVAEDEWIYADEPSTLDRRNVIKISKITDVSMVIHPAYSDTTVAAERAKHEERRSKATEKHDPEPEIGDGDKCVGEIERDNELLDMELAIMRSRVR